MGNVIMSGITPKLEKPVNDILAGDFAVGSSVYLNVNGVATEFIVVHRGIPGNSTMYDVSCNGVWLLMKGLCELVDWGVPKNGYENSNIHSYLNDTFFGSLDSITQSAIKTVTLPHYNHTELSKLTTKVFSLGLYEVGWSGSDVNFIAEDGVCLDYFMGTAEKDSKRIAYYNGNSARGWWLRTTYYDGESTNIYAVDSDGGRYETFETVLSFYARPALILPFNAVFDKKTLILKGVA